MRPLTPGRAALLFAGSRSAMLFAVPADQRLISLVRPSAEIVAGMTAPLMRGHPGAFLLITDNNLADATDFLALSGVDQNRVIQELILHGNQRAIGTHAEHPQRAEAHTLQGRNSQLSVAR